WVLAERRPASIAKGNSIYQGILLRNQSTKGGRTHSKDGLPGSLTDQNGPERTVRSKHPPLDLPCYLASLDLWIVRWLSCTLWLMSTYKAAAGDAWSRSEEDEQSNFYTYGREKS
ncbi:mCG144709, partial [Mus musculus]